MSRRSSSSASPLVHLGWGAETDRGLRRRLNEDSFIADAPVFLVADGMGGHEAGEVASAATVEAFSVFSGRQSVTTTDVAGALEAAVRAVRALETGVDNEAGTTVAGVTVSEHAGEAYWLVINLGDSRTYRLSGGSLEQISVDHSLVQELVDLGQLDAADAATDPRRNVVTRAIGANSDSIADYWLLPARSGDRLLVCSDGLSGELDDERITGILLEEVDPQRAATRLVHEALLAGGRDNVTVIVVDALSVQSAAQADSATRPSLHGHIDTDDTLPRPFADAGGSHG